MKLASGLGISALNIFLKDILIFLYSGKLALPLCQPIV